MQQSEKMREAVLELQCSRAAPERTFRIIVMVGFDFGNRTGAPGVGKTTIVNRFLFASLSGVNNNNSHAKQNQHHPPQHPYDNSPSDQQRVFANNYPTSGDNYHRKVYNIRGDIFELDIVDTSGYNPFPALKSERMGIMSGDLFCVVFSLTSKQSFEYAKRLRQEIIDVKCASFVEHLRSKKKSHSHHKPARRRADTHQGATAANNPPNNSMTPDANSSSNPSIPPAHVAVAKRVQVPMILVGNKMDTCESARQVSKIDINQYLTSFQEDDDMPYVVCSAISGLYVADIFALLFAFSRLPPELLTAPTLLSSVCEHGLTNDGSNNTTTADTLYYGCTNRNNNALGSSNGSAANGGTAFMNGGEKKRRFSIVPRTQSTRRQNNVPQQPCEADNAALVLDDEASIATTTTTNGLANASVRRKAAGAAAVAQRSTSRLSIKHDKLAPTSSDASLTSTAITSTNMGIVIGVNGLAVAAAAPNGSPSLLQNGATATATTTPSSPLLLNRTSSMRRPLTAVTSSSSNHHVASPPRAFATVMAYARRPSLRSEIETIKWRQDNPFYIVKRNNNESFARRLIGRLGISELCGGMLDGVGTSHGSHYSNNRHSRWWKPTGWFDDHHGHGGDLRNSGHYPQYGKSRARSTSRDDTLRRIHK